MAGALGGVDRRALLVAGALGLGGAALWRVAGRSSVPDLAARRRGDLVYLEQAGGADVTRALDFAIAGDDPAATVAVDRAAVEGGDGVRRLGEAGPVLVAFFDYRCPACRRHADALRDGARAGRFRLLVREWPILGPPSVLAARAALAAAAQGAYWAFHADLMATGFVPTAGLVDDLARRHAVDRDRLRAEMASPAVDRALARNAALAGGLGGVGTPLYVVDGVVVAGGWGPAVLLRLADRHAV